MQLRVVNTFFQFTPEKSCRQRSASDSNMFPVADTEVFGRAGTHHSDEWDISNCSSLKGFDNERSTCSSPQIASLSDSDSERSTFCESPWEDEDDLRVLVCTTVTRPRSFSPPFGIENSAPICDISVLQRQGILCLFHGEGARRQRDNLHVKEVAAEVHESGNASSHVVQEAPAWSQQSRDLQRFPHAPQYNERTSVMLRNIPNCFNRAMFMQLLDCVGFLGKCDFIYLPIDARTRVNCGYAFVNLTHPATVAQFCRTFEGFHNWSAGGLSLPTRKVCSLSWCKRQGKRANIESLRGIAGLPDTYKPVVSVNGKFQCFPTSQQCESELVANVI